LDTVEQARSRLNEWTISGLITSIKKDDTTFYRLRVGPYTEKAEAEKFLDWIRDIEGFGTSYISLVYNQRTVMN
jgi:cell division protein FtsN